MISVIIPIYNTAPYLEMCLQSVLNQTYKDLQVILIDDGSTDHSLDIAKQIASIDSRIHILSQSNRGQSAARNKGLQVAMGDYIAFIDSDDFIDPDYFSTLIAEIGDNDIVQFGYKRISQDGKLLKTDIPQSPYRLTSMCCRMVKHSFLKQHNLFFDEGLIYEDVMMSVKIWLKEPKIRLIKYAGYNYRITPHSTTANRHDTTKIYNFLFYQLKKAKSIKSKLIVLYTLLRLRAHFLLGRR